jgi:hypothetical protein
MIEIIKRFLFPDPPPMWSNREERRTKIRAWEKRKKKR